MPHSFINAALYRFDNNPQITKQRIITLLRRQRVKLRRELLGITQVKFSALLGLSFQQVQKYEKGQTRISCSRLWDIAKVLGTDCNYFFAEMSKKTMRQSPCCLFAQEQDCEKFVPVEAMVKEETAEMIAAYNKIKNPKVATKICKLLLELSTEEAAD